MKNTGGRARISRRSLWEALRGRGRDRTFQEDVGQALFLLKAQLPDPSKLDQDSKGEAHK